MARTCPVCNNAFPDGAAQCAFCGYHALGATQSFEPIDVINHDEVAREEADQQHELRVVKGPQTGINIKLKSGTMSVGRDPQCDIFLNDMTVSRTHAHIEIGPEGCIIRDANSFNGVWVNNRSVDAYLLQSGDIVQIGAFCLVYREHPVS